MNKLTDQEVWQNCGFFAYYRRLFSTNTPVTQAHRDQLSKFFADIEDHMIECRGAIK